jgi:hypothetical protein
MKKILSSMLSAVWFTLPALLALPACSSPDATEFDSFVAFSNKALPDYSEYGYNTAGANLVITSENQELNHLWLIYSPPSAYITKQDDNTFEFSMNGMRIPYADAIDISFTFGAALRDTLADLQTLSNTQYSMQKNSFSAHVASNNTSLFQGLTITSASLTFNRSRIIYTDAHNRQRGVSLSGTFEITGITLDDVSVKITGGRFDILFSRNNGTNFSNGARN